MTSFIVAFCMLGIGESQPIAAYYGADSHVRKTEYRLVTTAKAWRDVYTKHVGKQPAEWLDTPLNFDFSKVMVVAIFQGQSWNSSGVTATYEELSDTVRVRFDDLAYQTEGPDGGGVKCTAFGFFAIPRVAGKPVTLEENVQGLIGEPPIWKRRVVLMPD
jgi:hypothetical protein